MKKKWYEYAVEIRGDSLKEIISNLESEIKRMELRIGWSKTQKAETIKHIEQDKAKLSKIKNILKELKIHGS